MEHLLVGSSMRVASPPGILVVTGFLHLVYILVGLSLFRRMKRDTTFLRHGETKWSNRQAFLTFYPISFLPLLIMDLASLVSAAKDPSFLMWIAYRSNAGTSGSQNAFLSGCLALYLAALFCYGLPYVESLRRGPRSIREAAPGRFTRKRFAIDFTLLGLLQASAGFAMWAIAVSLGGKFHVPMILAATISSLVGVIGGQRLFVSWVNRKAIGAIAPDHPAVAQTLTAFEQAKLSVALSSIRILPGDRWPAPNAFAIGLGRKRCVVAVTEPLMKLLSNDEVAAILLHEYGHVREFHTAIQALFVSMVATWQLEFLIRGEAWLRALGMSSDVGILLVRQTILYVGLFGGLLLPFTLISRWCERRADRFAQKLGRGAPLASALMKLGIATETPLEWPAWIRMLATHPSFSERINALGFRPVAPARRNL